MTQLRCPRCLTGPLFADYWSGDGALACLSCGHVVYATPPLPLVRSRMADYHAEPRLPGRTLRRKHRKTSTEVTP